MFTHSLEEAGIAYHRGENDAPEKHDQLIKNVHQASAQEAYLAFKAWNEVNNPALSRQLFTWILKLLGQ